MITTRPKLKSRIEDLAPPSPALSPLSPPPSPYISHSSTLASPKPTLVVSMRRGGNGMGVDPEGVAWYLRWAVSPLAALRMLLVPLVLAGPTHLFLLFINWVASGHRVSSSRPGGAEEGEGWAQGWRRADWTAYNPFTPFFLVSYPTPPPSLSPVTAPFFPSLSSFFVESPSTVTYTSTSPPSTTEQLYSKGPRDLALLTWLILLFSLLRLLFSHHVFPLLARRWGISKRAKVERFGEQGYQVVYFSVVGLWGIYNMLHSRTGWFDTRAFWAAYPHTHLPGPLKAYYLTQIAYWLQQALVLGLGLEKRRSDHWELVIHHVVTVWMVTWSYMMNVTLLGNAVFVSMDIPDVLLAFSKMLNYLRLERAKVVSFAVFVVGWSYFRHYISIRILWSLRTEFGLVPCEPNVRPPRGDVHGALGAGPDVRRAVCAAGAEPVLVLVDFADLVSDDYGFRDGRQPV
ncbi:TLC domain-containing protein [Mycena galopus ATCC 62051]|nr:TLC domain-containing protein [Mycena galopus ATCC 62051]